MQKFNTVKELLSDPARWCKGSTFQDDAGNHLTNDKNATRFCLAGAALHVYYTTLFDKGGALDKLQEALGKIVGRRVPLGAFNDSPETTHADIMKVVEEAGI